MADRFLTLEQLLKMLDSYKHREFHVHHTWKPEHANFTGSNYQSMQNGMRNYHMGTNGWGNIAQHITLFPDGKILTGRGFALTPISIKGYNTGNFMMEMIGNFDKGHDKFNGKQKEVALGIARYFDNKGRYIRFHRENASKTCPGTGIDKAEFMKEVRGGVTVRGFIGLGSSDNTKTNIRQLQYDLVELGFDVGFHGRNGVMGNDTDKAIREFQTKFGLEVDGRFGKGSQAEMEKQLKIKRTPPKVVVPTKPTPPKPSISEVQILQDKLNEIQNIINR